MQKGLAILRGKGYYIDNFHSRGFAPRENLKFKRVEIMNKSKFLKKSLAMLLALMLVFAMIPLSASAAEGEYGSDPTITVNAVYPTLNDKVYTVEADGTTVALGADEPAGTPDGTEVVFTDKDGKDIEAADLGTVDLTQKAAADGNTYTLGVELRVPQEKDDEPIVTEYTLVITVVEKVLSNNAAIKQLTGLGDSLAEYEVGADTITIVSKFGQMIELADLNTANFVKADANATVAYTSGSDEVTVTAQDGKTSKTYTIEIEMRDGLTSFEIEGQIGETEITTSTADNSTSVKVTMPYGTDITKLVPTYELGPDVDALSGNDSYEIVSGETVCDFTNANSAKHLKLWVDPTESAGQLTGGTTYYLYVTIETAENTAGVLESIQVVDGTQKSNVTEVSGNNVTVVMPKGYNFGGASAKNVTLNLVGSKEADVEVLAQPKVTGDTFFAAADGKATLNTVDISSKEIRIRVSSEADDSEYNDYIITLEAAAAAEAKLENFIVKGDVDGDGVDETYEMDMETLTLELPYAAKAMAKSGFKVFVAVSTGATAYNTSNTEIKNGTNTLTAFFKSDDESKLIVVASDGTKATYDIKLDYADARTGRTLTSAELVGTNNVAEKTNDNTYSAVVTTAKMNGDDVDALRVSVPYSYGKTSDTAKNNTVFSSIEVSEGAVALRVNPDVQEISVLDPKGKGPQADATKVTVGTNVVKTDNSLDANKYTGTNESSVIYVVSEKVYVDSIVAGKPVTQWANLNALPENQVSKYYIYGVNMEAQKGASLVSIDSTLDENIDVTMKANNVIEIAVPYSYVNQNKGAWTPFSLNFRTDSMATMKDNNGKTLKSDLGSADTDGATQFGIYNAGTPAAAKLYVTKDNGGSTSADGRFIENFVVTSESQTNGKPTNTTTYTIQVKVNEAETGSALTSVEAAGSTATIASNRDVNLTLPYGTDKYPVQLDLEASKLATIYVGTPSESNASMKDDAHLYDPEKGYDLNGDVKILVVAEDNESEAVYTLKTTVAENFFDVAEDQWYYDEVLKAAENKWVNGTKPGYFEPNGTMTRGDFALIIARIKNYNPALYTESAFPDVESTDYYSAAIAYCKEMGYLGGENGYFNPKDPITREEMAKIICNAAGVKQVTDPTSPYADDDTIAEWAKGYVYGCQAAEIMMGDENANTFDARSNATRAEAAAVLVRAFA